MNNVPKLTARQRAHFLGVVEAASKSLRQAEIAKEAGISPSQVSRILRTQEAVEMVEGLRAKAMAESWANFQGLLDLAIQNLNHCLKSPLVHSSTKAQISMKLLQIALNGAIQGDEGINAPITIILGGQAETVVTDANNGNQIGFEQAHDDGGPRPSIENDFNHNGIEV